MKSPSPRVRARAALLGALVVSLACAYPLLGTDADAADEHDATPTSGELERLRAPVAELARSVEPMLGALAEEDDVAAEPAPAPPPPEPLTPEQITTLLDEATAALRQLEIKHDPRTRAKGPLPDDSGLSLAYADGRAMLLEGRLEQIRQWTALAKFGSREPGVDLGSSPLARYDLIVTRDTRRNIDTAYLHIVVPSLGIAKPGQRGKHEAWIGNERWINLADVLEPERDYLPFKTNGHESLHRQWARHEVVTSIVGIAGEYRQRTGLPLGIGDLSHVTGGKIEDHWTHQHGVDVDLYLLDPADVDADGRPRVWWNHIKRGLSIWTSEPKGKGKREAPLEPSDELSHTPTSLRLEILAQIVFAIDDIAYFVHNDTRVLAPFDAQAGSRRPGRRFLHADNRGFWPAHADHVHLRWVEGELPVGVAPRP